MAHNSAPIANSSAQSDYGVTAYDSDFLWAVSGIMLFFFLVALGWIHSDRTRNRIQHTTIILILSVSSVTYSSMAMDLGWTLVPLESQSHRKIFYVRYVQWSIIAPLSLLSLLSFTSLATPQILLPMFFACVFALSGLGAALTSRSKKWIFYTSGLFSLVYICAVLLGYVRFFRFRDDRYRVRYYIGAAYISIILVLYAICWGLSEGTNTISLTAEVISFGVLDLLSGPIYLTTYMFAFLARFNTQELSPTAFGNAERGVYQQQQQPEPEPQLQQPQPQPQPEQQPEQSLEHQLASTAPKGLRSDPRNQHIIASAAEGSHPTT